MRFLRGVVRRPRHYPTLLGPARCSVLAREHDRFRGSRECRSPRDAGVVVMEREIHVSRWASDASSTGISASQTATFAARSVSVAWVPSSTSGERRYRLRGRPRTSNTWSRPRTPSAVSLVRSSPVAGSVLASSGGSCSPLFRVFVGHQCAVCYRITQTLSRLADPLFGRPFAGVLNSHQATAELT